MKDLNVRIMEEFKRMRIAKGLGLRELAKDLFTDAGYYSKCENGKLQAGSNLIKKLEAYHNVSVKTFFVIEDK